MVLHKEKWDNNIKLNSDSDLLAVDCMYYKGVQDAIINHLTANSNRRAFIIL